MDLNFYNWMLVFARMSAFLMVLPFFSAANFPKVMRVALGAFSALLIAPLLPQVSLDRMTIFGLIGLFTTEIAIGLLLGFVARMVFYAADLAGNIIATEIGLNMGAVVNPATGQSSPIPSSILFFLAAIVMLTLDLHHWMLVGFQQTFQVLPLGGAQFHSVLFDAVVKHSSRVFVVALQIAAPVMAVSFVVTVVFAVLSRAVPQVNVFILSFPFRIASGLAVFGLTLHLTGQHVLNYLNRLPDDLLNISRLLGG